MSQAQDKVFFRNYSIVIGILGVFLLICFFVARLVVPGSEGEDARHAAMAENNTAPVGKVRMTGEAMPEEVVEEAVEAAAEPEVASEAVDPGKQVYSSLCFSCHGTGLPGIPQLGDKSGWTDRIAQGKDLLYENAINGFTGASGIPMPARGGNPALSDDEVKAAVDYMIANAE